MLRRGYHLVTEHEPGANLCDENPGVYWRFWWIAVGKYRNSHSKPGKPLYSRWISVVVDWKGYSYSAGVVTGYPGTLALPFFMPSETVKIGGRKHRLFYIPRTPVNGPATHLAIEDSTYEPHAGL